MNRSARNSPTRRECNAWPRGVLRLLIVVYLSLSGVTVVSAQQKGQYVPGQFGLNAGIVPDTGFTYENLALNYSASTLNDANGNKVAGITGTYAFWVDENILMYVPKHKFLGGYFAPWISLNVANGSLVGDIRGGNLSLNGGGAGFADTLVAPLYMGWHFKRADVSAGYAFFAPTGRYTFGASDNVGSGYWGNDLISGTTAYLTKNKGTSANLFIDWEHHGMKRGTNETPGQTFTTEWGLGQALPLDKDVHKLLQLGFVGYDQWQVSDNGGTISNVPARLIPHYSVHAIGVQTNFIAPQRGLSFFFKYYGELNSSARVLGRTIVFGGTYTLRIPKPEPKSSQ